MRLTIFGLMLLFTVLTPSAGFCQTLSVEYYHVDALGTVRAVTDQNGSVVRRHDYAPFGEEIPPQALTGDNLRFTGKERDPETQLDYFGARYYSNWTGRFTTVDPAVPVVAAKKDPQLWNRYSYVRNNPLRYIDPDGRCIWDACAAESIAAYEAAALATAAAAWLLSPDGRARTQALAESTAGLITRSGEALADAFSHIATSNDPFANERTKLGHLKEHLKPSDLEGARKDLAGDPVLRPSGRPYDHLTEVQDAQRGLQNLIEQLKARIGSGRLSKDELEEAQRLLGESSRLLDRTRQMVPRQ
jgi:RHS repeat-associated protein